MPNKAINSYPAERRAIVRAKRTAYMKGWRAKQRWRNECRKLAAEFPESEKPPALGGMLDEAETREISDNDA